MASVMYQVPVQPNIVSWPQYLWVGFKELLWYLTTDSKAAEGFPLSKVSLAYLWAGALALVLGSVWFLRKRKLI